MSNINRILDTYAKEAAALTAERDHAYKRIRDIEVRLSEIAGGILALETLRTMEDSNDEERSAD